jgi:hypothetical protein
LERVVDCLFGDLKKKLLFTWVSNTSIESYCHKCDLNDTDVLHMWKIQSAVHCIDSKMRTIEDRDKCIVFKELKNIWEKNGPSWVKGTFNESNTLLLDDSPYKALLNPVRSFPSGLNEQILMNTELASKKIYIMYLAEAHGNLSNFLQIHRHE